MEEEASDRGLSWSWGLGVQDVTFEEINFLGALAQGKGGAR